MPKKLKLVAVSYLNTKPLLYGIMQSGLDEIFDVELAIPSACAKKLATQEADVGLIPVAALPDIRDGRVISDYCIASDGPVRTVTLMSPVPLSQIKRIHLDYHSRTSRELIKHLAQDLWHIHPEYVDAQPGYEDTVKGTDAALIIGDRVVEVEDRFSYHYDLGAEWKRLTGLPFVYAVWATSLGDLLSPNIIQKLNEAFQLGVEKIPQLMHLLPAPKPGFDLKKYFTEHIHYDLSSAKKQGLELFLQMQQRALV